jgi:cytochrome P450
LADFASLSLLDNVRFNEAVIVPNALQGIFKRRPKAVAVATAMDVDGQAVRLLRKLRRAHDGRPVWVRVIKDRALLLLDTDDIRRALDGSPHPFASDPEAKRKGMAHFQPDALTISRGELWEDRRRFADAVLESGVREHHLAARFRAVVDEEAGALLDAGGSELTYARLHGAYRRLVRRIVLGDEAAGDEALSDLLATLMDQANGMPSSPSDELAPFQERMSRYLEAAPEGSLAGLAAATPATPDTRPAGQLTHWLFATQDTLCMNVLRALALVATHPGAAGDPRATLLEAMRLWPTTPLLSREVLSDLTWHGVRVPAGTNVLISNTFMHRDPDRIGDAADRFTPGGWADGGDLAEDRGLNFFSHGPQGCPGANLALLIGVATMRAILSRGPLALERPSLDPAKPLAHMLDPFAIRLSVGAAAS